LTTDDIRSNRSFQHISMEYIFLLSSSSRVLLATPNSSDSEKMSNEPAATAARRRSSTLAIPEGKPAFHQSLESELMVHEDEQLT
jgi:hypothetical protein